MASPATTTKYDVTHARNNTNSQWWRDPGLRRLNFRLFGVMLGSVAFGFDQALIGGLESDKRWYSDLGLTSTSLEGAVIAAVSFGLLAALFPAAYLVDAVGRRWSIIMAQIIFIAGAIGQTFINTAVQFLGTRILLGFVSFIVATASPSLLAELAHPRQRAQITAMYMTCFYVGSITAAWSCYGALSIKSSWSWRLPVVLQVPWAALQILVVYFCPESPRWLITRHREVEAKKILTTYHANNVPDDELVEMEFEEILTSIRAEDEEKIGGLRGWRTLFSTSGNIKRTLLVIFLGLAVQWVGNG